MQYKTPVDYVFIDNENQLRSKTITLNKIPTSIQDIPTLYLKETNDKTLNSQYEPVVMYDDPFRVKEKGKLVLCDSIHRQECLDIMTHYVELEPWFGMEQEYVLFDPKTNRPLGWPKHGVPESQVKRKGTKMIQHIQTIELFINRENIIVVLVLVKCLEEIL